MRTDMAMMNSVLPHFAPNLLLMPALLTHVALFAPRQPRSHPSRIGVLISMTFVPTSTVRVLQGQPCSQGAQAVAQKLLQRASSGAVAKTVTLNSAIIVDLAVEHSLS